MALILKTIAKYAITKLAADPRVRRTAVKAARIVAQEGRDVIKDKNRAQATRRAVKNTFKRLIDGDDAPRTPPSSARPPDVPGPG